MIATRNNKLYKRMWRKQELVRERLWSRLHLQTVSRNNRIRYRQLKDHLNDIENFYWECYHKRFKHA